MNNKYFQSHVSIVKDLQSYVIFNAASCMDYVTF